MPIPPASLPYCFSCRSYLSRSACGRIRCRSEQLLVFLAMTGAQLALYLLPVSGPDCLLEADVGSVPGGR